MGHADNQWVEAATIRHGRKMKPHIGISEKHREKIANGLKVVLANTYLLYLQTQNYHWNVTGPEFHSLHEMFEKQYRKLAEDVDVIAERIRALGFFSPGTFAEFEKLADVKEDKNHATADKMIENLVKSREQVVKSANKTLESAMKYRDQPTTDLLTRQMEDHEKVAWMLRSELR